MVIGTGRGGGGLTSCDYVAVLGDGLVDLSGTLEAGVPGSPLVSGVTMRARGPDGAQTTVTDRHGNYTFAVVPGTYTVTPGRSTTPKQRTVTVGHDTTGIDFAIASDQLRLSFSPASIDAAGLGEYTGSATVTGTVGGPVADQRVTFTPPLDVVPRALVCSRSGLVYPGLLSDGSPNGDPFALRTDANGVIPLSVWVGTQPGNWMLQAAEPNTAGLPTRSHCRSRRTDHRPPLAGSSPRSSRARSGARWAVAGSTCAPASARSPRARRRTRPCCWPSCAP